VRDEDEYFDEIPDLKLGKDMMDLAQHIVKTKSGHFEPEKFKDRYEAELKELIAKKSKGIKIEAPTEREPTKVINLMDALLGSVKSAHGGRKKKPNRGQKGIEGKKKMLFPIAGKNPGKEVPRKSAGSAGRRKAG